MYRLTKKYISNILLNKHEQAFYDINMFLKDVIVLKKEIINAGIEVKNTTIRVMRINNVDYISLTDLAKFKEDMIILFKTGSEANIL